MKRQTKRCQICAEPGEITTKWNKTVTFLRSVLVHFGTQRFAKPKHTKIILKCPTFSPFDANLTHFVPKSDIFCERE